MGREVRIQGYKAQLDQILSSLPEYLTVDYSPQLRTPNVNSTSLATNHDISCLLIYVLVFLHLGFFAVKFLILRAMMAPATSSSKSSPSSRLRYHFSAAMAEAENFMRFMMKIQTMDLHVFWFRRTFLLALPSMITPSLQPITPPSVICFSKPKNHHQSYPAQTHAQI
jgi:hypothetical protein